MPDIGTMLAGDPSLQEKLRRQQMMASADQIGGVSPPAGMPYGGTPTPADMQQQIQQFATPPEQLKQMPTLADTPDRPSTMPLFYPGASPSSTPTVPPSFADRPEDLPKANAPAPMSIQYGGMDPSMMNRFDASAGPASASAMQRLANQWGMGDAPLVPASQLGSRQGPSYGGGSALYPLAAPGAPAAAGTGDPIKDRIMSMLNEAPPSPVQNYNVGGHPTPNLDYGAQVADRDRKFQMLNELMKGQNEKSYQDKELALKGRALDQQAQEVGPYATAKKMHDARKIQETDRLNAANATEDEKATFWKKWNATNPAPKPDDYSLGKGGVPGVLPNPSPPSGTTAAAAGSVGADGVPDRIKEMTDHVAIIDPTTQKPSGKEQPRVKDPMEVMNEYYKQSRSNPAMRDPKAVQSMLELLEKQYTKKAVDEALSRPNNPQELLRSGMSSLMSGGKTPSTPEDEAKAAFGAARGISAPTDTSWLTRHVYGNTPGAFLRGVLGGDQPQPRDLPETAYMNSPFGVLGAIRNSLK